MTSQLLSGKTCLITGATSGIGKETALGLARMGATVALVGRDARKLDATVQELRASSGSSAIAGLRADLSSLASIRQLAGEVAAHYPQIHVLVNNAGGVNSVRQTTVDGFELTFALNHLAYFLLTNLLLDTLKASAPARVVNVSSVAHASGHINFDDLHGARRYSSIGAYGQSKLANVLFTYELARRLAGSGVTANALHPGFVGTSFAMNNPGWMQAAFTLLRPFARTPQHGAETSIYLASAPELAGVTGAYFSDCKAQKSSKESHDLAVAARLWQVSAHMTGLDADKNATV